MISDKIKFHQLQYLTVLSEQQSVRKTAEYCHVSAAAVSKALIELEQQTGSQLYWRQHQGQGLTPAGKMLNVRARTILEEYQTAMAELSRGVGGQPPILSVGVTPWLAHSYLPYFLQAFTLIRPDVQVELHNTLGNDYRALLEGEIDWAIGLAPEQDEHFSDLLVTPLFTYEHTVICRQGHPLAGAGSLSQLTEAQWLLSHPLEQYSQPFRDFFLARQAENRCQVHSPFRCSSSSIAFDLVEKSDLLSIVPWPLIETVRGRFAIEIIRLRQNLPSYMTSIVVRRKGQQSAWLQQWQQVVMNVLNDQSYLQDPLIRRVLRTVDPLWRS